MIMPTTALHVLKNSPIFGSLTETEVEEALRCASTQSVTARDYFFMQGETSSAFLILVSGRIKLTRLTPEGYQVILRFIRPGEPFGAIATLDVRNYPASAEAVTDSSAVRWNGDAMRRIMIRFPQIALNILGLLSQQFRELQDRYIELSTERVERRLARALLRLTRHLGKETPEGILIDFSLSRQDLAETTGTTLYTVSRILSRWETQGIVKSEREKVLITRPHGLVTIAEDFPSPED